MAVAYDTSKTIDDYGVTTKTTASFTIAATANRAAFIALCFTVNVSTVTCSCGSASGSVITNTSCNYGTNLYLKGYGCKAPSSGTQTATASWTTSANVSLGVIVANGVDQTTTFNNGNNTVPGYVANFNLQITSTNGDLTTTVAASESFDATFTTNQTLKLSDFACVDIGPGTGTTTHTWTHPGGNDNSAGIGANFIQYAAAGGDDSSDIGRRQITAMQTQP